MIIILLISVVSYVFSRQLFANYIIKIVSKKVPGYLAPNTFDL